MFPLWEAAAAILTPKNISKRLIYRDSVNLSGNTASAWGGASDSP